MLAWHQFTHKLESRAPSPLTSATFSLAASHPPVVSSHEPLITRPIRQRGILNVSHHHPSTRESEPASAYNTRLGLLLFALYLIFYGGFVLLNAFAPSLAETDLVAGVNLAVSYGLALIVAALGLAVLYLWLCRAPDAPKERQP